MNPNERQFRKSYYSVTPPGPNGEFPGSYEKVGMDALLVVSG